MNAHSPVSKVCFRGEAEEGRGQDPLRGRPATDARLVEIARGTRRSSVSPQRRGRERKHR